MLSEFMRKNLFKYLTLAFVISLIWQIINGQNYLYKYDLPRFFHINIYTLFIWAIGLFGIMVVYDFVEYKFKIKHLAVKIIVFLLMYWTCLIIVETVAYHVVEIRDIATSQYPGLPICNCLHAPWWMKLVYFALGPIMWISSRLLDVKCPFGFKKKKNKKHGKK